MGTVTTLRLVCLPAPLPPALARCFLACTAALRLCTPHELVQQLLMHSSQQHLCRTSTPTGTGWLPAEVAAHLQVVSSDRGLEDYEPADLALALCRMVSYNIGHLAYLNAMRYNLRRVIFGGFYIRGHSYTMTTLSFAIRFWSKVSWRACRDDAEPQALL